ncbi:hypothetical protein [Alistipes muris]|uniref:hypothetical protein n=1 Tax=Alistipes muris TaxID=2941326 RepID=UPI00203D950B|nr:hypothetical protein [Alistipes muris]MCX4282554.1 hypothetical protein [Alistipes sp.]
MMSQIVKTSIAALVIGCLFCGCKDDKIEIPKTLNGTVWTAQTVENQAANYTLAFKETECTLEKSIVAKEGSDEKTVILYDYTYNRPRVQMVNPKDETDVLAGEIRTDGKSYLIVLLQNDNGSFNVTFWKQ